MIHYFGDKKNFYDAVPLKAGAKVLRNGFGQEIFTKHFSNSAKPSQKSKTS